MANRKRNIQMKFYVTEDEKRLIDEKMSQLPTRRYGAYLRKMAIDGYIIYTDTADIKAFTKELSAIPCAPCSDFTAHSAQIYLTKRPQGARRGGLRARQALRRPHRGGARGPRRGGRDARPRPREGP